MCSGQMKSHHIWKFNNNDKSKLGPGGGVYSTIRLFDAVQTLTSHTQIIFKWLYRDAVNLDKLLMKPIKLLCHKRVTTWSHLLSASPHSWLCSFTVDVCNNCVFDWKTSDRRAAVHLKTLSTFLLGLTRSFTFFYLSLHSDGISSAGHMCSTDIRQKQLFFFFSC